MMKTKLVIVVGFALAFGAGWVIGRLTGLSQHPAAGGPPERSWLARELQLTPAQAEQIRKIWDGVARGGERERDQEERRRALRKERDDAVSALLPAERRGDYERIMENYHNAMTQLGQERGKAFEKAVEETRKLLSDSQRAKYDELLKKRAGERHGYGPGRRGDERSSSRPATQP